MIILNRIDPPGPFAVNPDMVVGVEPFDSKDFAKGSRISIQVGSGVEILEITEDFREAAKLASESSTRFANLELAKVLKVKKF
jgi:hypothetical protein